MLFRSDPPNSEHKRRPRYRGTHPRRFEERYKELAHEKYPDIVPHILAKGRTPAGQHVPIMVEEVLTALALAAGERAADCTLGYGGHARRILEQNFVAPPTISVLAPRLSSSWTMWKPLSSSCVVMIAPSPLSHEILNSNPYAYLDDAPLGLAALIGRAHEAHGLGGSAR